MKKLVLLLTLLFASPFLASAKPDPIDIEFGPWITNVSENEVTILWTTRTPNLGWVEYAPDNGVNWRNADPKSAYQLFAGRRVFGRFHSVTIKGLEKGQAYRYKIFGRAMVDDSQEQDLVMGIEKYSKGVYTFRTFDHGRQECHFSEVNDIHLEVDNYATLMAQVNKDSTDFILLNGDITTAGNYCIDTLVRYAVAPVGKMANKVPVMFSRGNHEGRGNNWQASYQVFPTRTPGQFYYTFRQGPVAFLVLDAGETKPMVAKSYVGDSVYFEYLEEELAWAREAVKDPAFADAPVKVCVIHVPMTGSKKTDDYDAKNWMTENFVPFLNEIGIDLMLNAHTHRYAVHEPGAFGNDFPMLINGRGERLQFDCDGKTIGIRTYDVDGNETHSYELAL